MMYVSLRHQRFLLDYLRTLDLYGSERRFGFEGYGLEILRGMRNMVDDYLDSGVGGDFGDEDILDELRLLLHDSKRAGKSGFNARVKALEMAGKYRGMWTGKGDESGRSDGYMMPMIEMDGVEQYVRLNTKSTSGSNEVIEAGPYRLVDNSNDEDQTS